MAFTQHQQQQSGMQQQYGFHPQAQQFPQQFPQQAHAPFLPSHPSLQQLPFHRQMAPQQQFFPHHHHPLLHLQQQPQPPHAFAPHMPPHLATPFMQPFDSAPPPAAPPSDPELQKRIDKSVEYAAKNGPEFEAMIREKQHDNPAYSFLFGGEGHNYYRYKLWLSTRPPSSAFNPAFPSSMQMMPSAHNPMLNPSALSPSPLGGAQASMLAAPQPPFPPYYDQHQQPPHSQPLLGQARTDYETSAKSFKGLSGPLPSDVAAELNSVLNNLTGTKESIKGAKMWFMQRSPFAPALAEALRDRIFALDDSERQLHIIFLANDILFDSLQRRINLRELDNEAHAFKPVLGAMLARIYNNPQNKDANQSRLEKILQFWASKEVYDPETIGHLEHEMTGGLSLGLHKEEPTASDPSGLHQSLSQWQPEKQHNAPGSLEEKEAGKQLPLGSVPSSQFAPVIAQPYHQLPAGIYPPPVPQTPFPGSLPIPTGVPPTASVADKTPPPYPLFPPGLIPGMVRKMQIGSGVPYSPMSPLDIPTVIPPSTVPPSEILERVSRFFKEIGEVNPSEGPMKPSESNNEDDDYEREPPIRKGGTCIPPPPHLQQVDPDTGMFADGSVDRKPGSTGSGRLGLGATANPNEVSQYDDVYSSYRKQRSTSYHSSMSARASAR
ncbi:hypothetical protein J5N97_016723 [Dioscorea zingiberensis]|uniref:Calcium homeostasis endoplasmic reticulum protein n=1 Tax=Dioscorea zingiberensis TaxID=325984 RepID=A0A9D5CK03_9LILI|nr:hypothetical protein J5N97_016723 [Dioscorea zingiberensis]